jgi:EAL domain-containing protein (putative c-di-GMP-specific phosphodiesterase class I)
MLSKKSKIERRQKSGESIVQAVVNIAAARHMTTTAEGVETQQQMELLRALGCAEMQGYLFCSVQPRQLPISSSCSSAAARDARPWPDAANPNLTPHPSNETQAHPATSLGRLALTSGRTVLITSQSGMSGPRDAEPYSAAVTELVGTFEPAP